ncbi:cytochrome P450 [Panus rudis PR-1116 ss-1]|nr:cytochrome P450 [Panus rudis PR-1116 ss-1]
MNSLLVGLFIVAGLYLWSKHRKTKSMVYPPGPKPLPVLGNVMDLTARELWLRATEWARKYGDIVFLHVMGQGLLFLNTSEVAMDLLDKKGSIYSDKPSLVMAGELCGCENMVAFTRYGDQSRRQRKLMQQALGASAIRTYQPFLQIQAYDLMAGILGDPKHHLDYIRKYSGSLVLHVVYGYRVTSKDDKYLMLAEECVDILSNRIASGGGIWPVDIFPFLKYLPDSFPGAGFKLKAKEWRAKMQEFVDKPYENLLEQMREGSALDCFCTMLLEDMRSKDSVIDPQRDFDIRWTANSMYSASLDTTITAVQHFIACMMLHPEVMKKAQQEIDSVTGGSRLPTFSDRESLPYVEAVMSEVLRWGVPVPLGLPHRLMEDDVYNGMFIPKGTLVFANIWNILRNEEIFPDAHAFRPERYLVQVDEVTAKRRDPRNYVFGFGRRKCPGVHLIESSLWIVMASMLATFDFEKAKDEKGRPIEPTLQFENSVFRTPNPFECDIRPRSEQAIKIVRHAVELEAI